MADTVLALVAHPDDESFWMGGTLAGMATHGLRVVIVAASDGTHGRARDRNEQFDLACDVLGAADWQADICFPDQQADTVPQVVINSWAEMCVEKWKPGLVLTHYHGDLNRDHRHVCEAALVATRDRCVVWMCTPEYPERCVGPRFEPSIGVRSDVFATDTKWAACQCYPEELAAKPLTRSKERLIRHETFVEVR